MISRKFILTLPATGGTKVKVHAVRTLQGKERGPWQVLSYTKEDAPQILSVNR